jgi:hypothetical protein
LIKPAGDSSVKEVTGSFIDIIPVSRRTVATQIVFEPDIAGYSVDSSITNPISASGLLD